MWWLAPHVDVDFNIVVVIAGNARQSSVADGGHRSWQEYGRLLHAVDGHDDDDTTMVQGNYTSLLEHGRLLHAVGGHDDEPTINQERFEAP
jgi:hypothetical protein